eukprot:SAG31_NODE_282_length_18516_cov_9.338600_11_plen_74_part_00
MIYIIFIVYILFIVYIYINYFSAMQVHIIENAYSVVVSQYQVCAADSTHPSFRWCRTLPHFSCSLQVDPVCPP